MPDIITRLYSIGSASLRARQVEMDVLADNLANINTPGFKARRASFRATLAATGQDTARSGVALDAAVRDFAQGPIQPTGQTWDLAIDGEGFFPVSLPDGRTAYTRVGDFKQDAQGRLVNAQGYALAPEITVPANAQAISIDPGGAITASQNGIPQVLGQLQLAGFANPEGLTDLGDGLYLPSAASGPATTGAPGQNRLGEISAGALEMSNVDDANQMISIVRVQRSYGLAARALQISDQMATLTNQLQG